MANDPAFLFYPGDYLRDTQCLSEACQVAYDRIMCEHMRNICITQEQLNFFTKRLTPEEKAELIFILKKMPGGFQIEWVAESIVKRKEYSQSRSKNRTSKPKKDMLTYDKHMENEIENVNESIVVVNNSNAKFEKILLENESVLGTVCFQLKINNTEALTLREMFIRQMNDTAEHHNNYTDYSKHFINWAKLNKGLLTANKSKTETTISVAEKIRNNLKNAE
jgi:hypothetical protein